MRQSLCCQASALTVQETTRRSYLVDSFAVPIVRVPLAQTSDVGIFQVPVVQERVVNHWQEQQSAPIAQEAAAILVRFVVNS